MSNVCHPKLFNPYINTQWCVSQTSLYNYIHALSHTYRPSFCCRPHLSRELTSVCCLFMSWDLITCFLLSVHVLRIVHCGCVFSSGLLHGVGWLLAMAHHGGVKIWTTSYQKPETSHFSLLLSVLLFKIYLKSCLQEACHINEDATLCLNIMWLDALPVQFASSWLSLH